MVAMAKRVKAFEIVFNDPSKTFYCSGDKVAGKILVEVLELTTVMAMKVLGVGCAKVEYAKGKQRCREEIDYLKYEDLVHLDDHPAGEFKRFKCVFKADFALVQLTLGGFVKMILMLECD